MTHEPSVPEDLAGAAARPQTDRHRPWLPAVAVLLAVGLVVAGGVGYVLGGSASPPAGDSVEAGFARDMQVHHAQAVEMSLIVREKSTDPAPAGDGLRRDHQPAATDRPDVRLA